MSALVALALVLASTVTPAAWQVELDAPIGLRSLAGAAADSAEITSSGGLRGGVAWGLRPWLLALDLGGRVAWPEQRGTPQVRLDSQQAWLTLGGRAGYRAQARGFVLEPFLAARLNGGARWRQIRVGGSAQESLQPLVGAGAGVGWIAGRGHWQLRLDLGGDVDRRGYTYITELAVGWSW